MNNVDAVTLEKKKLGRNLEDAAREGSLSKIKALVEAGADINSAGGIGQPPLTHLVFRFFDDSVPPDSLIETLECLEFFLKLGADPNAGDPSSFELSVELGNRKVLSLMLKHGADLNKKINAEGSTVLLHVALSHVDDGRAIDSGCAIDMIRAGADLSIPDELGNLPIHLACKNGFLDESMEILKIRPEDINNKNRDMQTPIILAAENGHKHIVESLLSFGAEAPANLNATLAVSLQNKQELQKSAIREDIGTFDLGTDDVAYLRWARDLGFTQEVQVPNLEAESEDDYVPSVRNQIDDWFDEFYVPIINALWDRYVPEEGPCNVLQGELSRCISRLEGELFKNGMMNMGYGYYDHMVDKIKETVLRDGDFSPLVQKVLGMDALIVKGADYSQIVNTFSIFQPTNVEESLNRMKMVVAAWCKARPEPIAFNPSVLD